MGIGTGIFLFVAGAVLAFALNLEASWIDLKMVGYLLMGAGFLVALISGIMLARKRQSVTTVHTAVDPTSGESVAERRSTTTPEV